MSEKKKNKKNEKSVDTSQDKPTDGKKTSKELTKVELHESADQPLIDFLNSVKEAGVGRLLPPPTLWQRFWQSTGAKILAGILILAMLAGAAYFYYYLRQAESDLLSDYVPSSAWLYVEFDLESNEWQALQQTSSQLAAEINDFFIVQGLNQDIIDVASQIALVGQLQEGKVVWAWLLKTHNPRQLETFLLPGTYLRQPAEQVAVISTRSDVVGSFAYRPNRDRLNLVPPSTLWRGFIRPEEAAEYFVGVEEFDLYRHTLKKTLLNLPKLLPFWIGLSDSGLQLVVGEGTISQVIWPVSTSGSGESEIGVEQDIIFRNINVHGSLASLEAVFDGLPLAHFFWQDFKERMANDYALNWFNLREVLDRPVTFTVKAKKPWLDLESLGTEPLLISDYKLVLAFTENLSQREQLFVVDLIKNIIARKYPREQVVNLPDESVAIDLIMDPESVIYDLYRNAPGSAHFLLEPQHEVIVLPQDSGLVIANNSDALDEYVDDLELNFYCGVDEESVYISAEVLQIIPWLHDFTGSVITRSAEGLNICLRS